MAGGNYSISITAGFAEPQIEWPSVLESDDGVVAFIKDLRKFGIGTTSKMDNMTGQLTIVAGQQVGIFQKALMYEPLDIKAMYSTTLEPTGEIITKAPISVWTLQQTKAVTYAVPAMKGFHPAGAYFDELYSNTPIAAQEVQAQVQDDYSALADKLSKHIPDIRKQVKGPCKCKQHQRGQVWYLIQHLNDYHHPERKVNGRRIKDVWTRERIADWLDEVDADLAFDPDLPAKREAQRQALAALRQQQREQLIKDGMPSSEQMQQIVADLSQAAGPIKSSMVKLNVAVDEFSKTIHKMVEEIGMSTAPVQGCTCLKCKAKLDLYPEKFPDQEES